METLTALDIPLPAERATRPAKSPTPRRTLPRQPSPSRHVIAIVGGGFSGTSLALALLRNPTPQPLRILLIDRAGQHGRGVAYARTAHPYLLNVPAARMSVDIDDPLDFLGFAQRYLPQAQGQDFLPRSLYGDYLEQSLLHAADAISAQVTLERVVANVETLSRSQRWQLQLDTGINITADDVVLATGNPPPATPGSANDALGHPGYIDNAWSFGKLPAETRSVLIIGTGLTMADVVLRLSDDEYRTPVMHAISRHGLLPRRQAPSHGVLDDAFFEPLRSVDSSRTLLSLTRWLSFSARRHGAHWQDVINGIRERAPQLWHQLSLAERSRFMRHLQCYWDVCRHRLPAAVHDHVECVRASGKLQLHGGRILSLLPQGRKMRVIWRPRGSSYAETLVVDTVINATGPDFNLERSRDPLLRTLHRDGLLIADPLHTGILTDTQGAPLNLQGVATPGLFYIGPMLRAAHWETTAARELQQHAVRLASHLVQRTRRRVAP